MNVIKEINRINEKDIYNALNPQASWHYDYKDSNYIYVGGLDFRLTEGDILTILAQYGEIEEINLVRNKESGESKGFCFLKYRNFLSTILAVDNFNGIKVLGRSIKVDHHKALSIMIYSAADWLLPNHSKGKFFLFFYKMKLGWCLMQHLFFTNPLLKSKDWLYSRYLIMKNNRSGNKNKISDESDQFYISFVNNNSTHIKSISKIQPHPHVIFSHQQLKYGSFETVDRFSYVGDFEWLCERYMLLVAKINEWDEVEHLFIKDVESNRIIDMLRNVRVIGAVDEVLFYVEQDDSLSFKRVYLLNLKNKEKKLIYDEKDKFSTVSAFISQDNRFLIISQTQRENIAVYYYPVASAFASTTSPTAALITNSMNKKKGIYNESHRHSTFKSNHFPTKLAPSIYFENQKKASKTSAPFYFADHTKNFFLLQTNQTPNRKESIYKLYDSCNDWMVFYEPKENEVILESGFPSTPFLTDDCSAYFLVITLKDERDKLIHIIDLSINNKFGEKANVIASLRLNQLASTVDLITGFPDANSRHCISVEETLCTEKLIHKFDLLTGRQATTASNVDAFDDKNKNNHNHNEANGHPFTQTTIFTNGHEKIPITVIKAKGHPNIPSKTLIEVYGAYGELNTIRLDHFKRTLLSNGWIYAFVHVRGGREKGWSWYEEGSSTSKSHSQADLIEAIEYLCSPAVGLVDRRKIAGYGRSAGAVTLAGAFNKRPDLFCGLILDRGLLDVASFGSFDALPMSVNDYPEFGSMSVEREREAILLYCPFTNLPVAPLRQHIGKNNSIQNRKWHVLVNISFRDQRIPFWNSLRWYLKYYHYHKTYSDIYLRMNFNQGHFYFDKSLNQEGADKEKDEYLYAAFLLNRIN